MPGFRQNATSTTGWLAWEGDPDDDAAHLTILTWLQGAVTAGFLKPTGSLPNAVKGNLGEFIAYRIGEDYVFTNVTIAHAANAWDPLSQISRPDVDIVWLYFGSAEADDWAALQEVKTTGQASMGLADSLITDYEKLFGENLQVTLQTRLGALGRTNSTSRIRDTSRLASPLWEARPPIELSVFDSFRLSSMTQRMTRRPRWPSFVKLSLARAGPPMSSSVGQSPWAISITASLVLHEVNRNANPDLGRLRIS